MIKTNQVPFGTYKVEVEKMKVESNYLSGYAVHIVFRVVDGKSRGEYIFYQQDLNAGYQIYYATEMLHSLCKKENIEFEGYSQFGELVSDLDTEINAARLNYVLEYKDHQSNDDLMKIKILDIIETI